MLKIVTLNVEHDRHNDKVLELLLDYQPDIALLQEVSDNSIELFEKTLNMRCNYAPLTYFAENNHNYKIGIMTCTKLAVAAEQTTYYFGDPNNLPTVTTQDFSAMARAVIVTELIKEQRKFCIANTHFTWSKGGAPSERQRTDCDRLLGILDKYSELVLCGDFNAPRGTEIFDTLAARYKDNVPAEISSTLDPVLHRAGHLNLVIDGIFSTPEYSVQNVRVINGVSDHCALVAEVTSAITLDE